MEMDETLLRQDGGGPQVGCKCVIPLMFLLLAALFVFHATKGIGAIPGVFPDEQIYSYDARLRSFAEDGYPNYLYYALFSVVDCMGERFLDAVRVLNAATLTLSGPFIYALARLVCGPFLSLLIMTLSLVSPETFYSIYFMPEATYFTSFWILAWLALRGWRCGPAGYGLALGFWLGIMALIKVHAVFLLPALALYLLLARPGGMRVKSAMAAFLCLFAAFAAVKFGISYLLAGNEGLMLFGKTYGTAVDRGMLKVDDSLAFLGGTLYNLFGHILILCLLFGTPLAAMAVSFAGAAGASDERGNKLRLLSIFALCSLTALMLMAAAFSSFIDIYYFNPKRSEIQKLQERYYGFLYPAFLLAAGYVYALRGKGKFPLSRAAGAAVIPILLLAAYAIVTKFRGFLVVFAPDCPLLVSLMQFNTPEDRLEPIYYLCALAVLPSVLWLPSCRKAAALFLFLFIPVYSVSSWITHQSPMLEMKKGGLPNYQAMAELKTYLGNERGATTIFGRTEGAAATVAFYLDDKNVEMVLHEEGPSQLLNASRIKPGSKWLVLYGSMIAPPEMVKYEFKLWDMKFYDWELDLRLVRIGDVDFSARLGGSEHAWPVREARVDGEDVVLAYAVPLPSAFRIRLVPEGNAAHPQSAFAVHVAGIAEPLILDGGEDTPYETVVAGGEPGAEIRITPVRREGGAPGDTKLSEVIIAAP